MDGNIRTFVSNGLGAFDVFFFFYKGNKSIVRHVLIRQGLEIGHIQWHQKVVEQKRYV